MLRMDGFEVHTPPSLQQATQLYAQLDDAHYIAGGTDLLPNLKHRIFPAKNLIALGHLLHTGWHEDGSNWVIGAGTPLTRLGDFDAVPPLAQAALLVAGPQIRNMGTIGGNILLDTRCLFYNQTAFWRKALGHCLKADGDWCHVIGGPKTCVAAQSSDTVPVLLALNASIGLLSETGQRVINLRDLYNFNGMDHLTLDAGEILTEVMVPKPGPGFVGSYDKVRTRGAIDFPQLGVAICAHLSSGVVEALEIVVGAINPRPKPITKLQNFVGQPLNGANIKAIGELVFKQTRPQASVQGEPTWRRHMARQITERRLSQMVSRPS